MKSFKNYKDIVLSEEFDEKKAVQDAEKWLESKYGKELYVFKHMPDMEMSGEKIKTYDIVVGENTYILNLKKFDSNGDGSSDTVGFDVKSAIEDKEEDKEEEDEL